MPVLSYKYVSDWFHLEEFTTGRKFILKEWSETQDQPAQDLELMQGSIGPHVKNIGGSVWSQTINTPIIVFENFSSNNGDFTYQPPSYGFQDDSAGIYDGNTAAPYGILDLFVDYWQSFTDGSLLYNNLNTDFLNLYVIQNANLVLNEQGSTMSMEFRSDRKGPFSPVLGYPLIAPDDFIGRTAKPWDVTIQLGSFTVPGIIDMTANFQLVIDDHWFMFPGVMSTTPFFAVKGYHITGKLTALLDATQLNYIIGTNPNAGFDPTILNQVAGTFYADNVPIVVSYNTMTDVNTGTYSSRNLILASQSASTKITKQLNGGDVGKVTIEFSCFARPNGIN